MPTCLSSIRKIFWVEYLCDSGLTGKGALGVRTRDNVSYRSSADARRANCEAPERADTLDMCAAVSIPKTKKLHPEGQSFICSKALKFRMPRGPLPHYRLFDALHNIPDIIVTDIRSGRQTETNAEKRRLDVIGINRSTLIDRLLVHWLPDRPALDLLAQHEHSERLDILVRLAIGGRAGHLVDHTRGAAHGRLDHLLVRILLADDTDRRIQRRCAQPVIRLETPVLRLLMYLNPRNIRQQLLVQLLHMTMMLDMRLQHRHLTTADTSAHIRHAVIIPYRRMSSSPYIYYKYTITHTTHNEITLTKTKYRASVSAVTGVGAPSILEILDINALQKRSAPTPPNNMGSARARQKFT